MNTTDRRSTLSLTDNELKVLAAAVYNGQLSGKLKTFSGIRPSETALIATDLYDRLKWHLEQADLQLQEPFDDSL